jgi:hypothetical protein
MDLAPCGGFLLRYSSTARRITILAGGLLTYMHSDVFAMRSVNKQLSGECWFRVVHTTDLFRKSAVLSDI